MSPYIGLGREFNKDIHDVVIKNITTAGLHHGLICLAAGSNQVYNIKKDGVYKSDEGGRKATVSIYTGYGTGYNAGNLHDIAISNVVIQKVEYAVKVKVEVKDVNLNNIVQNNPEGVK